MAPERFTPSYMEKLRDQETGLPLGPALGPAFDGILSDESMQKYDPLSYLWGVLQNPVTVAIPEALGVGLPYSATFIPGHTGFRALSEAELRNRQNYHSFSRGPTPGCADVVIVGKHPGFADTTTGYLCSDETGAELLKSLDAANVPREFLQNAYVTTVCRFQPPRGAKVKKVFVDNCQWFLWAELAIIQPKLVILLGSEAIKHFYGNKATVTKNRGTIMPLNIHVGDQTIALKAFATMHPIAVSREPSMRSGLASDLRTCYELVNGIVKSGIPRQYDENGPHLRTVEQVERYVDDCIARNKLKFAIDCEWEGRSVFADGTLLTVQLSHGPGNAALVVFNRHPRVPFPSEWEEIPSEQDVIKFCWDGQTVHGYVRRDADGEVIRTDTIEVLDRLVPNFTPDEQAKVVAALKRLLHRDNVRVGGHNFRADFPWLEAIGVPLHEQFRTGFDTMLKHHILFESVKQDLSSITLKYTDCGRYDQELNEWVVSHDVATADGYGQVPEHILYHYALYDADVTFRIDDRLDLEFQADSHPIEDRLRLAELVQSELDACMGILEIEKNGMHCDRDRVIRLAEMYDERKREMEAELRQKIAWPQFNFRSVYEVRELLFGEEMNGKKRDDPDVAIRLRPEHAYCCYLDPIKTTGKPSMDWDVVMQRGAHKQHAPSTDKEVLGILSEHDEVANLVRQLRFIDQVCKNFTSLPKRDPKTKEIIEEGGLLQHIDPDQRIRTHIVQTLETGRWASRAPNKQNLPKRREKELKLLFSENKRPYAIRSVLMASPGHILIECDYAQAELAVLALLSGDPHFWDVLMVQKEYPVLVNRATREPHIWLHPEWVSDADYRIGDHVPAGTIRGTYKDHQGSRHSLVVGEDCIVESRKWKRDLHAERAIDGFQMPYIAPFHGPPKDFVEETASDKRVAAKTVNFGIPYGRSAAAVARELKQDGVIVEVSACQKMIDGFFTVNPLTFEFLDKCRVCVSRPGWLVNPFGRYRRFHQIDDRAKMAQFEREACNFPIQSTVAELLNKAVYNCWYYRQYFQKNNVPLSFKIVLGVHDALLFEVPIAQAPVLMAEDGFLEMCMSTLAPIPLPDRRVCNGLYEHVDVDKFPYAIGTDKDLFLRWNEKPKEADLLSIGLDTKLVQTLKDRKQVV